MALSDLLTAVTAHGQEMAAPSLLDTATIQRASRASDGQGGSTVTYPTHLTNVPCSVSMIGNAADESQVGEATRAVASYLVRVPVGTDVGSADRVLIGSDTYEVIEANERTYEATRRLVCRAVG